MKQQIRALHERISGGVLPALATPLTEDGYQVNRQAIPPLVEFLLDTGVKGLFVGGTTGEGILLAEAERRILHEEALAAVHGRVPVLLHVGTNTTQGTLSLARHAAQVGADAIAVVTPTFYGMHDDALLAYYQQVAEAAPGLPLFAYDIPHMAVNGVSPALFSRLLEAVPTLAGLKSSRSDAQIIRQQVDAAAKEVMVLAGNERVALGSLALGVDGLISGLATAVPEPFVALTRAFFAGDLAEAQQQQRRINRLLDQMPAGARIGAIKAILQARGLAVGPALPPRPTPDGTALWSKMAALLD